MKKQLAIVIILFVCQATVAQEVPNDKRLNAVKITFLSWFSGSSKVSYERALPACHQTMEVTAGCIGAGFDKYHNKPIGVTTRYAHKFMLAWDKQQPLNGFYLRPELIYSHFKYDQKDTKVRATSDMGALIGTFGFQWAMHRVIVDSYFGGGYAWGTEADTHYQHGFSLWDYFGHYNKNIAMTFSIKVGYAF